MSMWADYQRERKGAEVLEWDHGFATYHVNPPKCYLENMYVEPEFRKQGYGPRMTDKIAELGSAKGCNTLLTTVDPQANGATNSMRVILSYGFNLSHIEAGLIILEKSLESVNG